MTLGDINDLRQIQAHHEVAEALGVHPRRAEWRGFEIAEAEDIDSRQLSAVYLQVLREIASGREMPTANPYPDPNHPELDEIEEKAR